MQWDTRNFGQKLGAGLGAGLQNLSQLMLILQGQKREDAEAAESKRRFEELMNFRREQAQPQMPLETIVRPEFTERGAMGTGGGDYQMPPMTRTPMTQPQNTMPQSEPYKPMSAAGKQLYDEINMGLEPGGLNKPKEKTPPKVKDVPNLVEILLGKYHSQTPDEKTGQMPLSIDDIFNQTMRHRFGLYRQNFPEYFGPNAEDSILATAQNGSYSPYQLQDWGQPLPTGTNLLQMIMGNQEKPLTPEEKAELEELRARKAAQNQ